MAIRSLALLFAAAAPAMFGASYTLEPTPNGQQLKTPDGRVVFEYLTKKPENSALTSASAACFHPVRTPKGETVTALAPNDHPHHRGVFIGWHDSEFIEPSVRQNVSPTASLKAATVRRADFWAWGVYAPRDGRVIQNKDIKLVAADANHAELEIHNDMLIENRRMGSENDRVVVTERDGVFILDLTYEIAPTCDYILKQNAFGGFDVQFRKDGEAYYANAGGKPTYRDAHYAYPELDWPSEPWYDFTIKLKDGGKTVGGAVIDHPLNPPTKWHVARSLYMLNPVITALGPITIHPDAPLTLRYRVVTHDGDTPTELLQKLSAEFRAH